MSDQAYDIVPQSGEIPACCDGRTLKALGIAPRPARIEAALSNDRFQKLYRNAEPALMTPVTAANRVSLAVALTNALRRGSLISAVTRQQDQRQGAAGPGNTTRPSSSIPNQNGLLSVGMLSGTPPAMPQNQLMP